jgi:uncharacterized protein YjbI with pentapeptide repeats
MSSLNLSGVSMKDAVFINCDFSRAVFKRSDLENVTFKCCDLMDADLELSCLAGANFTHCNISGAILRDSDIKNSLFSGSDLREAVFSSSFFQDSEISLSDLEGADFTYSDIKGLKIADCKLKGANFIAASGLSERSISFFRECGAKVDGKLEKYLSYAILSALIILIAYGSGEIFNRHVKMSSDIHNIRPGSPNIYSDLPDVYLIKKLSYEKYRDYIEKNNFGGNLIKNGDFSSGLDWWMSSNRYYKTSGSVKADNSDFHSAPACVRVVTKNNSRMHSNSGNKDFSDGHPYINYTEIKGYRELAFSFWYKLNPVNAYIINIMDGSHSMLSVVDVPCRNTQWNNFSAIIELPPDRPIGFEVEITFGQGETLVDDIELKGRK